MFAQAFPRLAKRPPGRLRTTLAGFLTFHFVCASWVLFRAPSLEAAQAYLATLAFGETTWGTTMTPLVAAMLAIGAVTQLVPSRWLDHFEVYYDGASLAFKVALPFMIIFLIAIAAPGGVPPFIYFQF
jgi:alginate O-acetyltransferase complex protein AlgI